MRLWVLYVPLLIKLFLQLLGEVDICEPYYWPTRGFSRASHRCSSYNMSLGSFDMVDLCLWDALSRWCCSWRVFPHPMYMPIFKIRHINSCMFMIISDHYIIKQHVSHAWYGCRAIKTLVEAQVYDGFTVSCRGLEALLIIARPLGVSILLLIIRLA